MDFYSASHGIRTNPQIPLLLKTHKVRSIASACLKKPQAVLLGWGYKSNTLKTRQLAQNHSLPYWALEDGFISWLKHPVQAKAHERLSYIIDKTGIYYDASKPSGLDVLLSPLTAGYSLESFDSPRVERLLQQLIKLKVSKYNQARGKLPDSLQGLFADSNNDFTLLVDQTFNDASIEFSGGSEDSFKAMLQWGLDRLAANPSGQLILKVHPDVILGKKKGYLHEQLSVLFTGSNSSLYHANLKTRIHVLSDDVSPSDLISRMSCVATVSSQLGFEALWQNKEVHCFAWPFYAGRGLTHDHNTAPLKYLRPQASLYELLHAGLILYPTYLHPDTQLECQIEEVLDYMQAHFLARDLALPKLNVNDVSLWKRSFIPEFLTRNISNISFNQGAADNTKQLYWGMKQPEKLGWRMEDGFIRSVGLGADLRRPSSLVLDDMGIYYNGKKASRLELMLNEYELNDYEVRRTQLLSEQIQVSAITKYNVVANNPVLADLKQQIESFRLSSQQEVVLVTGQFQQDLSMEFGALDIKDNLSLLRQVRSDFPDAYLIYKEHPDVYSGVRPGRLDGDEVLKLANSYVADVSITDVFEVVDRVCTICSLAGFEALLRGLSVSTYGLPFYAGWGLTSDKYEFERRHKNRSLNELLYITLVLYGRYVDWGTRQLTTVESCICQLLKQKESPIALKSSWFSRQLRKLHYLSQALLDKHLFSNSAFQYFKSRSR